MGCHNHSKTGDKRIAWAIAVNLALTVSQIIGGILSGSLALVADALHNLSDAISLITALVARKIGRKPANSRMTFGYGRAEIVAALINYTTLIILGVYLVYEAIFRLFTPQEVSGWLIVVIALIALLVDIVTALLTWKMSKTSINIRAAFLHNIADALGSVAVIIAGSLILMYDWFIVDSLVTFLVAGYVLWHAFAEIGNVIHILMLGSPTGMNINALANKVLAIEGVTNIHHVHLWQIDEYSVALDAHIVVSEGYWSRADGIKQSVKTMLSQDYSINHTTLELEYTQHICSDTSLHPLFDRALGVSQ